MALASLDNGVISVQGASRGGEPTRGTIVALNPQTSVLQIRVSLPQTIQELADWPAENKLTVRIILTIDGIEHVAEASANGGIREANAHGIIPTEFIVGWTLPYGFFDADNVPEIDWPNLRAKRIGETAQSEFSGVVEFATDSDVISTFELFGDIEEAPQDWRYHSSVAYNTATALSQAGGNKIISVSHTATGSNRGALVYGGSEHAATHTVTYAGNSPSITRLWNDNYTYIRSTGDVFIDSEMGSGAQTVELNANDGTGTECVIGVLSMTGVHQTVPAGTAQVDHGNSGSPSVTVGGLGADDLIVDGLYNWDASGLYPNPDADQTRRVVNHASNENIIQMSTQAPASGGVMSWGSCSAEYSLGAVAFKPSTSDNKIVTPDTLALVTAYYVPTVVAIAPRIVTPPTLNTTWTGYVPIITIAPIPQPISFVNAGAPQQNNSSPLSPAIPANTAKDDTMYLICLQSSAAGITFTPPTGGGWVSIGRNSNTTRAMTIEVFRKTAVGGDSAPSVACSAATAGWCCQIATYRHANRSFVDATSVNADAAAALTWQPTGITTATDNAWFLSLVGSKDDNALNHSVANGFTLRMSGATYDGTIGNGSDYSVGLADKPIPSHGAQTSPTWQQTVNGSDAWVGIALALRPAVDISCIPPELDLQWTGYAATVFASNNKSVVPPTLSLAITGYEPTITIGSNNAIVTPDTLNLAITGYVPTIVLSDNKILVPSTLALSIATYVPAVATPRIDIPVTLNLVVTGYVPTIATSDNKFITPSTLSLSITGYAPTIARPRLVVPSTLATVITTYVPTVTSPRITTPATAAFIWTGYVPDVEVAFESGNVNVVPQTLQLQITGYVPDVVVDTTNVMVIPATLALQITGFAADVDTPRQVTPNTLALSLSGYAPHIDTPRVAVPGTLTLATTYFPPVITSPRLEIPGTLALVVTGYAPIIGIGQSVSIIPGTLQLALSGYAPDVSAEELNHVLVPLALDLEIDTYEPIVQIINTLAIVPAPLELVLLQYAPLITLPREVKPTPLYMAWEGYAPVLVDPPLDIFAYDNGAIRTLLIQNVMIQNLTQGRVYADELPDSEAKFMPRKAIVINSAGGTPLGDLPIGYRTKDIRCYAETPYEASRLWAAVHLVLKSITRQLVTPIGLADEPVLIYSAARASGPIMLREPDTTWPLVFGTYQVLIADEV